MIYLPVDLPKEPQTSRLRDDVSDWDFMVGAGLRPPGVSILMMDPVTQAASRSGASPSGQWCSKSACYLTHLSSCLFDLSLCASVFLLPSFLPFLPVHFYVFGSLA